MDEFFKDNEYSLQLQNTYGTVINQLITRHKLRFSNLGVIYRGRRSYQYNEDDFSI